MAEQESSETSSFFKVSEMLSTGIGAMFGSKSDMAPELKNLEEQHICDFLEAYDIYGLHGGSQGVKKCISDGVLSYMCIYELPNHPTVEDVTEQDIFSFLNKYRKRPP